MNSFITSKALRYLDKENGCDIVNLISGKTVNVDSYVAEVLRFCSIHKTEESLKEKLSKDHVSIQKIDSLLLFLQKNRLLIANEQDAICDLVKRPNPFYGFGNIELNKMVDRTIAFFGIPFGAGNAVDSRCKDFPDHFRNVISHYFSIGGDFSLLRPEVIHSSFNIENLISLVSSNSIKDLGNIFYVSGENSELYYQKITQIVASIASKNGVPFAIGGDHSVTYPIIKGLSRFYSDFTIFHFDAHADYKRSELLSLYDSIGMGLLNHATVMNYCERNSSVSNIIQFGVREPFMVRGEKIISLSLYDIKDQESLYQEIVNKAGFVYLSFDIDFFDPIIAPGTASKLINGGSYDETFNCLSEILQNKDIIGVDIVEVNPELDDCDKTSQLVMHLALHLLGLIKHANQ